MGVSPRRSDWDPVGVLVGVLIGISLISSTVLIVVAALTGRSVLTIIFDALIGRP